MQPLLDETPVEPSAELLGQLLDMGFPEVLARQALVKVKNESIAAAVEAVMSQRSKGAQAQWACERCTVVNAAGGTTCHLCGGPAPATALADPAPV